jgi:hypothetical protein
MKHTIIASCTACGFHVRFDSEPWFSTAGQSAAIGLVSAGSSFEQGKKMFSVMGVKFPDNNTFVRNLVGCDEALDATLQEVLEANRQKERELAEKNGTLKNGIAEIDVICDGAYSMTNKGTYLVFVMFLLFI